MTKIKYCGLIATSILLFVFLIFFYKNESIRLPFSFFDEELWIREAYFFEFYSPFNFNKEVWKSDESSNQPKLTEYVYGIWLYPKYFTERRGNSSLDYTKFLINKGFYSPFLPLEYQLYKTSLKNNFVTLGYGDSG